MVVIYQFFNGVWIRVIYMNTEQKRDFSITGFEAKSIQINYFSMLLFRILTLWLTKPFIRFDL